jgi:hypothetical protein
VTTDRRCSSCNIGADIKRRAWRDGLRVSSPVVPTDVVDETGLVGFDAFETADAVTPIIGNEVLRCRLAEGARALVLCN